MEWVRDVADQCKAAGVAAFVKQLGGNSDYRVPNEVHAAMTGDHCQPGKLDKLWDNKGGDINEFPVELKIREFPRRGIEKLTVLQ